ncbi:MAG: transglutaminase domain-containing protein [Bacillota bacterium]|nr:transglutaminase domain-containing protein [Bacillota bacterium]
MKKLRIGLAAVLSAIVLFTGCSEPSEVTSKNPAATTQEGPVEKAVKPEKPAPLTLEAEAVMDPSVAAEDIGDPYTEINKYIMNIDKPNRDLYNTLFYAVNEMKPSLDISAYNLSYKEKNDTAGCLYSEKNYRFYYLNNVKVSKDGKTAIFTYTGKADEIRRNKENFYARLSHLLYNVAPEDYTELQKFMAVYEYVCETSNYSPKPSDFDTMTPYSILARGEGICWGYANLMEYTLNKLGINTDFVKTQAHAWDIVKLGGKLYNTDVTWGAGNSGTTWNDLTYVLMDDKTRLKTLKDSGIDTSEIILGYPKDKPDKPPACTDKAFSEYFKVGNSYALDIDNSKVYFSGDNGIEGMNLDCTGRTTIAKEIYPSRMYFFNGALYFINSVDEFLYRMIPGQKPELMEGKEPLLYLELSGTLLYYGKDADGKGKKSISLLPFDPAQFKGEDAISLPEASVPRTRSFSLRIKFSSPVEAPQNWNDDIYLADEKGNAIPLHFELGSDGKTLTLRPKYCLADSGSVSLYIKQGVASQNGQQLTSPYNMNITIH